MVSRDRNQSGFGGGVGCLRTNSRAVAHWLTNRAPDWEREVLESSAAAIGGSIGVAVNVAAARS